MYKRKLSALIITYNEIGYIEECLASILFADEIIVIDSYSDDGTYEYLLKHPRVRVIQKPFLNFTEQKTFAVSQSSNDWVLFLDADEVITPPLREEIVELLNSHNPCEAYWFYKKFMFMRQPLHFCGWRTDKNYRLFNRSKARFTSEKMVHETLDVQGPTGIAREKLIHYSYKSYADYKSKMLHYGRLKAREAFYKGKKFNYLQLALKPLWKFSYHFIVRLGLLDTRKGLIISYLSALGEIERYSTLRRLCMENKKVVSYQPVESYN